jgi:outer membrane protein OmpA-like peptidoglycan-associated protein
LDSGSCRYKGRFFIGDKENRIVEDLLKSFFYIFLFFNILVSSCAAPPDLTHTACPPPPEPVCKPGLSTAKGIDTANIQSGYFKYHIDLLPKHVNSDYNDNAITFLKIGRDFNAFVSTEKKGEDGQQVQRIVSTRSLPDLHFTETKEISVTEDFDHIGAAVYCNAEEKLYFTAKAHNDDPNDYDLYSAKILKLNENQFELGEITALSILNKVANFDGQPAMSKDGLMIVFASDRAGGHGGVDLWYSIRKSISTSWKEPIALPAEVNTPCDELSPSFSADGKILYFSSNGHETIGGYDLFSSVRKEENWSQAENIGSPVNTEFDEIFPYQLSDSQFFYTSDQSVQFKGRNILVLRRSYIPPKDFVEKKPIVEIPEKNLPDTIELKGKVELPTDGDSVLPEVFVRDVEKNKEIARKKTDTTGNYSFNVQKGKEYDVGSELKDKFYDVHRVDLRHPTDSIISVAPLIVPDTLVLRLNFPFNDDSHPYDFIIDDKGQKTDMRWQTSIDLIAKSIKNSSATLQNVILYGHTDSLGTDEYNFGLAKRRAAFVAKQLEMRGIPAKLFIIFPKGRTMPVVRAAGESDEIFQLRCRRVEFIKSFTKVHTR